MILLLGANGYFGQAFASVLQARGLEFSAPSRSERDYTRFSELTNLLRETKAEFLINAAGFTGKDVANAPEAIAAAETVLKGV